jgi:hypothetical protein
MPSEYFSTETIISALGKIEKDPLVVEWSQQGKSLKEKTKALFIFFAFDNACKILESDSLNIDPDQNNNSRELFSSCFEKLVEQKIETKFYQMEELGDFKLNVKNLSDENFEIKRTAKDRFSSDFLNGSAKSGDLKRSIEAKDYPSGGRGAKLLCLGGNKTCIIRKHPEWEKSLKEYLSNSESWKAFLIYCFRVEKVDRPNSNALFDLPLLRTKFTEELSQWLLDTLAKNG